MIIFALALFLFCLAKVVLRTFHLVVADMGFRL